MSQKTIIKLIRQDKFNKLNTVSNIYNMRLLSSLEKKNRFNILKVIKKSILGTNYCYWHAKNNLFASAITNFVIINTCFVLFPQIIFNTIYMKQIMEEMESLKEKNMLHSEGNDFLYRLSISNFIDITLFAFLSLYYKYKEKQINKYMEIYTQYAIKEENDILIKNKIYCEISSDEFDIEIKKANKNFRRDKKSEEFFFKYIITFPNIYGINNFLYHNIFSEKEKEIINNINAISDEIDFRYKKKLIKFIITIVSILICIPIFSYISTKKKLDMINYVGIFSLFLYVQLNIFLKNKKEQIKHVSSLNERYFKDGYFIYINNDIISIFYLKEDYQINSDINEINKINEKFMKKYEINF